MGAPLLFRYYGGNSSVGRAPDCDSGCRGFEPRISPHSLLGFQPNTRLKKKSERDGEARELAHILQGYERLVLDVIIEHSNRKDIALLVHDCVVFYNKQSRDELTRIVKENTGFELEFSEKQY